MPLYIGNISGYLNYKIIYQLIFVRFFVLIIQENKEQVINDDREISRNFLTIIFNPLLKVFALLKQIIYAFFINEIKYSLVCLKR